MNLDLDGVALSAIWKEYQVQLLRYLFRGGKWSSNEAWLKLHDDGFHMSRASVINSLNSFVADGIATMNEESCKGGYRGLYQIKLKPNAFENMIIKKAIDALNRIFPNNYNLSVMLKALRDYGQAVFQE